MKTIFAVLLALAAGAPVHALAQPVSAGAPGCDVSVSFGSYAMGIDQRSYERVERYVARKKTLVRSNTVTPWGREGERTVCIATASSKDSRAVFFDIRDLIMARAERGPTEIRTAEGRVWRSTPGPG